MTTKRAIYLLAATCLLVTLAACSKCAGGKSDAGQGNKQDYIAALDAICSEAAVKNAPIVQEMRALPKDNLMGRAEKMERLKTVRDETSSAMEKIAPQPSEDAATLAEFWAAYRQVGELLVKQITGLRTVSELADKAQAAGPDEKIDGELQQASAEFKRLSAEVTAAGVKVDEVARKYGFKSCGVKPQ